MDSLANQTLSLRKIETRRHVRLKCSVIVGQIAAGIPFSNQQKKTLGLDAEQLVS